MAAFGKPKLFGLKDRAEGWVTSYVDQVAAGTRRDSALSRLRYLARSNYAYNYIHWLRKRSNDPVYLGRVGAIERRLKHPFASRAAQSLRAADYHRRDFHIEHQVIPQALVDGFRDDLYAEPSYCDPYVASFRHHGRPEASRHPFLYMDTQRLFENEKFLEICASDVIVRFCREALGPSAALTWAWSWISNPTMLPYQNQNWHRDSAEPLNFLRVFIPLQNVYELEDGPTELIPGTSSLRQFYDVRRYSDGDLAQVKADQGAGVILCEAGDVYFVNTFALHRGRPPQRQRAILTLLVSLSPSHRTPSLRRVEMKTLPERVRAHVAANRSFFRYVVR